MISVAAIEEIILRRVFGLCFLNTVEYGSYRQVLNPRRCSEISSAKDYTITDYNYVSLKRKQMSIILQSITDQPGPRVEPNVIIQVLQRWLTTDYEVMLESYVLDETTGCLVVDDGSLRETRPLVIVDICPRGVQTRISFNVAFLKKRLPDLMGDRSYADMEKRIV